MDYQLFNLENVSWKLYPVSQPRETLSVTNVRESIRLNHILPSVFESVDHVPPNFPNSSHPAQLCSFEGNAAVIHMINEGRSPNPRHVTRTHRVDLDWLFD